MLASLRGVFSRARAAPAPACFNPLRSQQRWLCGISDEQKAEVETFLRNISRPIMGKAKAKQSAGQKALDLTKQLSRLDDVDMDTLLRMNSAELKNRGERVAPSCYLCTQPGRSRPTAFPPVARRRALPGAEAHPRLCLQGEVGMDLRGERAG